VTRSLDAYDLVMRSLPLVWSYDAAANGTATELLEEALSLDTGYLFFGVGSGRLVQCTSGLLHLVERY
jgi:hypothetical protein